jgi:hypothetical protein
MQSVHNLPDDLSLTEDALVGHHVKTLLSLIENYAASWRLLVLDIGWNCTRVLELRPVIYVPGWMR